MSLRTVADDTATAADCTTCADPTGWAVSMYSSTTARRMAALRSSSMGVPGTRCYRVPAAPAAGPRAWQPGRMRFVVVGAGAVGGVVGGRLAQHDHDVVLVARGDHGQAIAADGLLIRSPDDEVRVPVPVVSHPSELTLTGDDVVLLAVKGQDTAGGARGAGRGPARPRDRVPPERRGQRAPGPAADAEHLRACR